LIIEYEFAGNGLWLKRMNAGNNQHKFMKQHEIGIFQCFHATSNWDSVHIVFVIAMAHCNGKSLGNVFSDDMRQLN